MICYIDPSALVKRYVAEPESSTVIGVFDSAQEITISLVGKPEVLSAIYRRTRERRFSMAQAKRLCRAFEKDWQGFYKINVSTDVIDLAGGLIARYSLRGFDAIHIASALVASKRLKMGISFLSFDQRQNESAFREGLMEAI